MKKEPSIVLSGVHLKYLATAFKERSIKKLLFSFWKNSPDEVTDVEALKNISLTINKGERVGLIGHNGAGKSTFLKMLAGLYPPSRGTIQVDGTIRSLFDISLGFEPEATGRENILYRGLLLGLTPKQVYAVRDEIIDFAGLGEFIDYPIKTYSAGMQVRLAFAISTVVTGEILLLDEVVGAGDATFITKARKRITDLIDQSQILVFASHDNSVLEGFCTRGLVFNKGSIVFDGEIGVAIKYYKENLL